MADFFTAVSPSLPSALPPLLRLPDALLSHVCSYLPTLELLVTLARTAKRTRDTLIPACFSTHTLQLGPLHLSRLAFLDLSSARSLAHFHARVLTHSRLQFNLRRDYIGVRQLLAALDRFPTCRSVALHGLNSSLWSLTDSELCTLLHHPVVQSCADLRVDNLARKQDELATVDGGEQFQWANIRLPAVTRLALDVAHVTPLNGAAAFLVHHSALQRLDVHIRLVSIAELTALFHDSSTLPQLAHFTLRAGDAIPAARDSTALVIALATTVVSATGSVRPVEQLTLHVTTSSAALVATTGLPQLTRLHVSRVQPGWLKQWTTPAGVVPVQQLQHLELDVVSGNRSEHYVNRPVVLSDVLPFLQSIAAAPLQLLDVNFGGRVRFDVAAMNVLAGWQQLRELYISADDGLWRWRWQWMDWTDPALFDGFSRACLPHLRTVKLDTMTLGVEGVAAIASAAPQLQTFATGSVDLTCHPAVVCAVIGGYCEHVEVLDFMHDGCHDWRNVQAAIISGAYHSAMTAAGQGCQFRPFTRLRTLHTTMGWSTPPAVWYALLSLMKWAVNLRVVSDLQTTDPLIVAALGYLPSITSLSVRCWWPFSFATFMQQRSEQTGRYRYLASQAVSGEEINRCPGRLAVFKLSECAERGEQTTDLIELSSNSHLFPHYQHSLSDEHQAVLTRWASGDFRADDERLSAAESPSVECEEYGPTAAGAQDCHHPHTFHSCRVNMEEVEDEKMDDEVSDSSRPVG